MIRALKKKNISEIIYYNYDKKEYHAKNYPKPNKNVLKNWQLP